MGKPLAPNSGTGASPDSRNGTCVPCAGGTHFGGANGWPAGERDKVSGEDAGGVHGLESGKKRQRARCVQERNSLEFFVRMGTCEYQCNLREKNEKSRKNNLSQELAKSQ